MVEIIRYTESVEMYQHLEVIVQEKNSFKNLIDLKKNLKIELRNFDLEK
jgi:hypothetical protein